jgi:TnpA family transposase
VRSNPTEWHTRYKGPGVMIYWHVDRKALCVHSQLKSEQAAMKVLYLTAIERRKNRTNPTGRINGWKKILNTLTMHYGDRVTPTN